MHCLSKTLNISNEMDIWYLVEFQLFGTPQGIPDKDQDIQTSNEISADANFYSQSKTDFKNLNELLIFENFKFKIKLASE